MSSPVDASPFNIFFLLPTTAITLFSPRFILLLLAAAFIFSYRRSHIPGPGSIAAALALSSSTAHRALAALSGAHTTNRLMAFSLGFSRFVVSSHPETAKEILNSSAFADRPVKQSARELLFHRAMGFAPYGEYWRNLRRISATHLFCPRRIEISGAYRREIGEWMLEKIMVSMGEKGQVAMREVLHFGALNNVMMTVFGTRYELGDGEGVELEGMVKEGYELLGALNWGDHFPIVRWMDLQGVRRRSRVLVGKVNAFVGRIIVDHRRRRKVDVIGDFVDLLLDLEEEDKLSDSDMVAVLWEMIFRGTDTVAILLEWIIARMVLHPDIQSKAQAEIDATVGSSRSVTDADIPNLRYLQSIVKESLRMHPPGPLLSWARLAIRDARVGNYVVPAGTTAMVNMWAIAHDGEIWSDPDVFKPERFLADDVNVMGTDLRLAPFGSGRRVCPGKAMGLAAVHIWLAQLLQNFRWVPASGGVDLSECLKMSLEMKNHLVCCAVGRDG